MYFFLRLGWQCQFLEPDMKTTAARPITFQNPAKIVVMAERGNALKTSPQNRHSTMASTWDGEVCGCG